MGRGQEQEATMELLHLTDKQKAFAEKLSRTSLPVTVISAIADFLEETDPEFSWEEFVLRAYSDVGLILWSVKDMSKGIQVFAEESLKLLVTQKKYAEIKLMADPVREQLLKNFFEDKEATINSMRPFFKSS